MHCTKKAGYVGMYANNTKGEAETERKKFNLGMTSLSAAAAAAAAAAKKCSREREERVQNSGQLKSIKCGRA